MADELPSDCPDWQRIASDLHARLRQIEVIVLHGATSEAMDAYDEAVAREPRVADEPASDMSERTELLLVSPNVGNKFHQVITAWWCEDCGWPWPLQAAGRPPEDSQCDACGGRLTNDAE